VPPSRSPSARTAPSTVMSARDLEFLLYEWRDVESLTTRERFADHSRETFDAVLDADDRCL
jgi:Acyl-CoA dehydrogenase N terminal